MIDMSFVRAGRAIFTVSNDKGDHYTFRVKAKDFADGTGTKHFVSLLTGPENTSNYTYMGMLSSPALDNISGKPPHVFPTAKSKFALASKPVQVFNFAMRVISGAQALPAGYDVKHAGRCGRCGRLLTVPESIDRGIGPECSQMMGGF